MGTQSTETRGQERSESHRDDLYVSQQIAWDATVYIGYSAEQIELIRVGFFAALDRVYEREVSILDEALAEETP